MIIELLKGTGQGILFLIPIFIIIGGITFIKNKFRL